MSFFNILNKSVATRTTIMVLFLVAVLVLGGGMWQVQHVRKTISEETHRQANRSMDGAIRMIDNRISNVETAVKTAASYADMFATQESKANEMLERLIAFNEDIAAITLMYKENYFPQHGRYFAPTITRDPVSGKLERDEIGGPENDFCYLETDSNWIYTNLLDRGYWCLPYMDSISTKRAMISYSVPLHDSNGQTYAVLCADVDLRWVEKIVEDSKPYHYSKVMVLSRDSQYVCHPNQEWVQSINVISYARQTRDSDFIDITSRMLKWEKGKDTISKGILHQSTMAEDSDGTSVFYFAPIERVQWSVCFSIPEKMIMKGPDQLQSNMLFLLLTLLIAIAIVLNVVIHAQLRPMKMLEKSAEDVAKGNFLTKLPDIKTRDEIRNLRDSFEKMQHSLVSYVKELKETTAQKALIVSELKVANDIQMSMLPKVYPPFPERDDLDIFGQLKPAKAVGGDLFDFFIRDEKLMFCIGDVSGKGVPAALVMAVTRALFRSVSATEASPDRIVSSINGALSENNDSSMFVTLFVGVLDLPTGRLRYTNAGHDAPLLLGSDMELMAVDSNLPVGVLPDWKFTVQESHITPQTIIFLYTDGLTEAENIDHDLFGEQRILDTAKTAQRTPRELIDQIAGAVQEFVGEAEQSDDLTMLAIQYTKKQLDVRFQRSITLPNDVSEVPRLAEFVDSVCEAMDFDMGTTMQLNLAIEEAVVNVMNYAYPSGTKGDVTIEAQANEKRLKFVITDQGMPFDPTAKKEVDTTLSAEERSIGGLGIHLVRQIMDSINYERVGGTNVLTLRKKL